MHKRCPVREMKLIKETWKKRASKIISFFLTSRHANDESLNCDLTAQFIIRIHGLPLGSLYPATVIVAVSVLLLLRILYLTTVIVVTLVINMIRLAWLSSQLMYWQCSR